MNEARTWADRVAAWESSGESAKAFAEGKSYTAGGLYYWRRRLRLEAPEPTIEPVRMEIARVVRPSVTAESAAARSESSTDEMGLLIEARGLRVLLPRSERALFLDVVDVLAAGAQGGPR